MTEQECAEAVTAWIAEELDELVANYSYLTAQRGSLPDVMVDVEEKAITAGDTSFPFSQLQNRMLRVFSLTANIMVEQNGGLEEDRLETEQLRDFGSRLEVSGLTDATLGGRVFMLSPLMSFTYALPFVEYPDGTRGRQMQVTLSVGELADQEDSY